MSVKIEELPLPSMRVGEGPYWLEDQQALVVVDAYEKTLYKHYVETGHTETLRVDSGNVNENVTVALPVECTEDMWMVGLGDTISVVSWPASNPDCPNQTSKPFVVQTVRDDHFNDAKCDPRGRLWAGTTSFLDDNIKPLNPGKSHLYKLDENLEISTWVKDLSLSNGMAWSSDKKHFYHADTSDRNIYHYDYDDEAGAICNQRVLLNFKAAGLADQAPDGMTIDQNDNLWVASLAGSQVLCVDPRCGEVVRRVEMPVKYTLSVCWGGKDYSTLFLTTGTFNKPEEKPPAGKTFAITGLGVKGCPPSSFKAELTKLRAKMEVQKSGK